MQFLSLNGCIYSFLSYKSVWTAFFILQELADMHLVFNKSWHIYSIFYPTRVGRHAFGIQQELAYILNFLAFMHLVSNKNDILYCTCIWYPTRDGIYIKFVSYKSEIQHTCIFYPTSVGRHAIFILEEWHSYIFIQTELADMHFLS